MKVPFHKEDQKKIVYEKTQIELILIFYNFMHLRLKKRKEYYDILKILEICDFVMIFFRVKIE